MKNCLELSTKIIRGTYFRICMHRLSSPKRMWASTVFGTHNQEAVHIRASPVQQTHKTKLPVPIGREICYSETCI
jgi:hypothetical protein